MEVLFDGIRKVLSSEEYNCYIFDVLLRSEALKHNIGNKTVFSVKPNYNHFLISEFINKGGTCITFNFDELVEIAYKDLFQKELQVVSFPMENNRIFENEPTIIKAHGSFSQEHNSTQSIGIDIQHLHINGFSSGENVFLSKRIENKHNVIFYGYSISDSLDFIPFINNVYKDNKINVYYLNYDPSSSLPTNRHIIVHKQRTGYFQADYFLKKIVDNFYFINYNPNNSFAKIISLPHSVSSNIYTIDNSIVESVRLNKKTIVKLSLFKSLGLLNKFGDKELDSLSHVKKADPNYSLYLQFHFYKQNINGFYGSNVKFSLRQFLKNRNLFLYNNLFDMLNEYLFLTPPNSNTFLKILLAITIFFMWLSLLLILFLLKRHNANYVVIRRNLYMPFFRLTRGLKKGSKLSLFLSKCVLKSIIKAKNVAIMQNNLNLYRFIEKERIKMIFIINGKTNEIINQLDELITLNIDTNYFIDIANLLRLKYEITNDKSDKHLCEVFTLLTKDKLNKSKLK